MALNTAIFDLDGVVVDTVPIHFKAWKKMFSKYGHEITFDDYKQKVDGIPRMDGARSILTDISDDELKIASDLKQKYFLEYLQEEPVPRYDSTIKLIYDFKQFHINTAVVSSSKNCPDILRQIGLYDDLDVVLSGADITKGKPDPQIFLMAAKKLNSNSSECVVFEDAVLGVEAAKRAEMKCVGIDRYGNAKRLSLADIVVSDLSEIDFKTIQNLFN